MRLIEGGHEMVMEELPSLGKKALSEYLRAMKVKLGEKEQTDAELMRGKLREKMDELHVTRWRVS